MENQDEYYMFLWYPAPGVTRGFGVLKPERISLLEIFKPITLPYTLAFIFGWPMITFLRFGLNDIGDIFENKFTTNYIRGGLEISGLLLTAVLEGFMGRRCLLLTLLTSSAIAFFAISYPTLPMTAKKVLFWFTNIPTTSANTLIILLTLCVYPTCLSSITIGMFTALACIGEVVAPVVIDYVPFDTGNQDIAFFAMGFVALMGGYQISFAPHTIQIVLSQEFASSTTFPRSSAAVFLRLWRMLSGRLRGDLFSFSHSFSSLHRRTNCCTCVEYEEADGDAPVAGVTSIPNPSVQDFKV